MTDTIQRLRRAGYKIRTKEQWGSRHLPLYADRLRSKPVDFPVAYGFVHITVTRDHGDAGMRTIEDIGFDRFGTGCSYNWAVDHKTDHTIYIGQPLAAKGAHTVNEKHVAGFPYNLNYAGHAVAFMGMVEDAVCDECVDTIAAIFAAEQLEGQMRSGAKIYPHRKFAAKACPGDKLNARMDDINKLVVAKVHAGSVGPAKPAPKPAPAKKTAKKTVKKTNVEQARDLLAKAEKYAEDHKLVERDEQIEVALDTLPEK